MIKVESDYFQKISINLINAINYANLLPIGCIDYGEGDVVGEKIGGQESGRKHGRNGLGE